MENDISPLNN